MKVSGFVLACGLAALTSASTDASVFTFPAHRQSSSSDEPTSLPLPDAKLLLAQWLGLSRYYDLEGVSDQTLTLLNRVGGSQTLFSEPSSVRRLLVLAEGLESTEIIPSSQRPQFRVSVPADADVESLVFDLLRQDQHRRGAATDCGHQSGDGNLVRGGFSSNDPLGYCAHSADKPDAIQGYASLALKDVYKKNLSPSSMDDSTAIFHVTVPETASQKKGKNADGPINVLEQLKKIMSGISSTDNGESTVVLIPRAPSTSRRGAHHKRNEKRNTVKPRVSQKEAPLSVAHASKNLKPSAKSAKLASNATVPKTTIASCWASEKACVENTLNCTGHGQCNKKYTERVSSDEEGPECWACQCTSTVVKLDGGATKTTYWGGPACQKKDISVPFFLFAGFTVAAMALVSWGIGMLYSMGQQDLPSVLAAGVAPVTRK